MLAAAKNWLRAVQDRTNHACRAWPTTGAWLVFVGTYWLAIQEEQQHCLSLQFFASLLPLS